MEQSCFTRRLTCSEVESTFDGQHGCKEMEQGHNNNFAGHLSEKMCMELKVFIGTPKPQTEGCVQPVLLTYARWNRQYEYVSPVAKEKTRRKNQPSVTLSNIKIRDRKAGSCGI